MSVEQKDQEQQITEFPSTQVNTLSLGEKYNFYIKGDLLSSQVKGSLTKLERTTRRSEEVVEALSKRVIGQEDACRIVARRAVLAAGGLHNPTQPMGAIFELGPTGVGKTEMAHALSDLVFDDPYSDRLKIINMGEFSEQHDVRKFVGSPPSYIGSDDPIAIQHNWLHAKDEKGEPLGSIIVLDEFEKAHPHVAKIFLSVLDKGVLTARNKGYGDEVLNFTKSFIFFTSNIGASEMQKQLEGNTTIGFGGKSSSDVVTSGKQALQQHFRWMPEFVGRLSDIVVFKPLEPEHYQDIFYKIIDERNKFLKQKFEGENTLTLSATNEFRDHILSTAEYKYGVRGIQRLLETEMFEMIVDLVLEHSLTGGSLVADYDNGEVDFYTDAQFAVNKEVNTQNEQISAAV